MLVVSGLSEPACGVALIRVADALSGCLDRWVGHDDQARRLRADLRAKSAAALEKAKTPAERAEHEATLKAIDASPPSSRAVEVKDVVLRSDEHTPAHLELTFADAGVRDWCLAESWWPGAPSRPASRR